MIAKGWTYEQIEMAMVRTSVRYGNNIKLANKPEVSRTLRCTNLRIKPIISSRRKDGSYLAGVLIRPTPRGGMRSCGACCYHAYGYFIRTLFDINNSGLIKTREAKYMRLNGFLESFPTVAFHNIGSNWLPLQYDEACVCYEYGLEVF